MKSAFRPISIFATLIGCCAPVALSGCEKHTPPDVAPLVASIRADAAAVAVTAAKQCGDLSKSGRMTANAKGCSVNLLPGETIVPEMPSPAKGTALETNASVANVFVMCNVPITANESCGSGLGALRKKPDSVPVNRGPLDPADSTCKKSPTDCDEVVAPSHYLATPDSADFRVIKPVVGGPTGATAEVTIVLQK